MHKLLQCVLLSCIIASTYGEDNLSKGQNNSEIYFTNTSDNTMYVVAKNYNQAYNYNHFFRCIINDKKAPLDSPKIKVTQVDISNNRYQYLELPSRHTYMYQFNEKCRGTDEYQNDNENFIITTQDPNLSTELNTEQDELGFMCMHQNWNTGQIEYMNNINKGFAGNWGNVVTAATKIAPFQITFFNK